MNGPVIKEGVIGVGRWDDTGESKIEVRFKQGDSIHIETSSENWIYVDQKDIMGLIAALSRACVELGNKGPDQ